MAKKGQSLKMVNGKITLVPREDFADKGNNKKKQVSSKSTDKAKNKSHKRGRNKS